MLNKGEKLIMGLVAKVIFVISLLLIAVEIGYQLAQIGLR
jgi:hypothetical protein